MFKIAVCDDEGYYRKYIKESIATYMKEVSIEYEIDIFDSGEKLIKITEKLNDYDIIFLDINMKNRDGIEVAQYIRRYFSKVEIVFVTAYVSYALEGYKVNAIRYLLKGNKNFIASLKETLDAVLKKYVDKNSLTFSFVEGNCEIALDNLIYIESRLHKLKFYLLEQKLTMYEKLNSIEENLKIYNFIRIHQSFIVNLKYVETINNYKARLITGKELSVPKSKYRDVKDAFILYKGEI
ncbi:LytTR family DNA-binding domain-containing protein [Lachnospiraceae bacterium ZAX-1]